MKLPRVIASSRKAAGILLIECVTYIAVFAILTSIGFAAFYLCWDNSKTVVRETDDIAAALRAGERWRADVRGATGKIAVESSAAGEVVRIPGHGRAIIYRFEAGQLHREVTTPQGAQELLPNVRLSHMSTETRDGATAWRWELQLAERSTALSIPVLFTFEAAQAKP
jgi:Tfp pilus assembly protein FimT